MLHMELLVFVHPCNWYDRSHSYPSPFTVNISA